MLLNAFLATPLAKPVAATPMLLLGGLLPHAECCAPRHHPLLYYIEQ